MAIVKKKPPVAPKVTRAKKVVVVEAPVPVVYVSAFSVGNRVTHPVFGDGKVTAIVRDQLSIQFASSAKVVLDSFVKASSKG